ncbi:MAG: HIT family protein [Candidatus Saccharimonadales bacterium]
MPETIFDKIISGEIESHIVWENDTHIAFLTPFPNTPGLTVVIPKINIGDNVFALSDNQYGELMKATKIVANILEKTLDVKRVALVFEGTGVAHVHAKLYPLYGPLANETNVWVDQTEFVEEYRGFITTLEGPKMDDSRLDEIRDKIIATQQ